MLDKRTSERTNERTDVRTGRSERCFKAESPRSALKYKSGGVGAARLAWKTIKYHRPEATINIISLPRNNTHTDTHSSHNNNALHGKAISCPCTPHLAHAIPLQDTRNTPISPCIDKSRRPRGFAICIKITFTKARPPTESRDWHACLGIPNCSTHYDDAGVYNALAAAAGLFW